MTSWEWSHATDAGCKWPQSFIFIFLTEIHAKQALPNSNETETLSRYFMTHPGKIKAFST